MSKIRMGLSVDLVWFVVLVSFKSFSDAQSLLFPMPSRIQETSDFVSYGPQQQAEEPVSTDSRMPTQDLFRPIQTPMPFEQRIPVQIPVQAEHRKLAPSPIQFEYRNPVQKPTQVPVKYESQQPARKQQVFQLGKQSVQGPVLNHMVKEAKVPVEFELKNPVSATSVAVQCGEDMVRVEVKQDFLGNGQLIRPSDLTLGGCTSTEFDHADQRLLFESELQECRSTLTITEDVLIYTFTLIYTPTPVEGTPIVRTNYAEVGVECHYQKKHNVTSNALKPTWVPYAFTKVAEQQLVFSLRLMTDDWQFERPSSVYFLGHVMNIEASIIQDHHTTLRVYVDSCVATLAPEMASKPRYSFIENHGCLTDARQTGSKSHFLQQTEDDKLQFQLEAFRFHQDERSSMYITCHLRARSTSASIDSEHKACSFTTEANRWVSAGGDDQVCGCCDSTCGMRKGRSLPTDNVFYQNSWEAEAALGPILVQDSDWLQMDEFPEEQASQLEVNYQSTTGVSLMMILLAAVCAAVGVVSLTALATLLYLRLRKPHRQQPCR
ncbi:zona pellucida sperm-binding protein 3 [Coregonus clupeaformis]|uniref:zona pellucida sperm-binding protein 3 n=1 Tax=Coregonus clupeaformis TaxID=59861 RepID=UPI001E1C4419|nr:zona pellucida sperm-binding protein 3 [Coregonus clupeaformis]